MNTLAKKLHDRIDYNALAFAFLFSLFLILFEWVMFNVEYRHYIFRFLPTGNFNFVVFCLANMIFSFLIFILVTYLSFVSSWQHKIAYFLIFALAIFYEYGYQKAYGRFSDITDLYIASGATWEQTFAVLQSYINMLGIIPCLVYLVMLVTVKNKNGSSGLKSFLAIILLFVSFYSSVYYFYPKFFNPYTFPTISYGSFSRTSAGYFWARLFDKKQKREAIKQPALSDSYQPNNNIVLIVDESVRGDHLSLNGYSKQTTPYLEELAKQSLLQNWGIAVSGSTCSIASHNMLITGFKTDELPDQERKIWTRPSVFQFAKAMRYKTYYLDGQRSQFWGGIGNDLSYIDVWLNATNFQGKDYWETDFLIAKKVNEIINSSTGNFIFVFKHGVHAPFKLSFPNDATTWSPSISGAEFVTNEDKAAFSNGFDNALKFNLDSFFKTLAADYKNLPNNTVILYTSDHGQTLSENGERFSHCGDTRNEAIVPLFIFGNLGANVDTKYKASHANILATLLDLMNYAESLRKYSYAKSLLKATEKDSSGRHFFTPNLISGRRIKFD
jgi:glucan phosphoethanolaminetransferase (alkaline phosphatase superfamily)